MFFPIQWLYEIRRERSEIYLSMFPTYFNSASNLLDFQELTMKTIVLSMVFFLFNSNLLSHIIESSWHWGLTSKLPCPFHGLDNKTHGCSYNVIKEEIMILIK